MNKLRTLQYNLDARLDHVRLRAMVGHVSVVVLGSWWNLEAYHVVAVSFFVGL